MAEDAAVDLIDDDEAVRQSLAFLLDSGGIAARTHESAIAFLAALPALTPACIVTEVRKQRPRVVSSGVIRGSLRWYVSSA